MRQTANTQTVKDTACEAYHLPSVGLSKKHDICRQMPEGVSTACPSYAPTGFCVDALPVSDWRGIGKAGSTPAGSQGSLYSAWLSLLPRSTVKKLAVILSGRKTAGTLDRCADYH